MVVTCFCPEAGDHFSLAYVFVLSVGATVWQIGSRLSSDAIGMGVGVLFGIMAGLPTALLVLATGRRRDSDHRPQAPAAPTILMIGNGKPEREQWHVTDAREWLLTDSESEVRR